jgi:hypothetical protein
MAVAALLKRTRLSTRIDPHDADKFRMNETAWAAPSVRVCEG